VLQYVQKRIAATNRVRKMVSKVETELSQHRKVALKAVYIPGVLTNSYNGDKIPLSQKIIPQISDAEILPISCSLLSVLTLLFTIYLVTR